MGGNGPLYIEFERSRFGYTESGHRVAVAMIGMFVDRIPGLTKRLGVRGVCALLDAQLLDALGLPRPTALERHSVEGALKLRARIMRVLPARRKPRLRTAMHRPTYPRGHRIEDLGPHPSTPPPTSLQSG